MWFLLMLASLSVCVYLRAAANWSHTRSVPLWQTSTICFVFLPQGTLKNILNIKQPDILRDLRPDHVLSHKMWHKVSKHSKMHLKWHVWCAPCAFKRKLKKSTYFKKQNYTLILYKSKKSQKICTVMKKVSARLIINSNMFMTMKGKGLFSVHS